MAKRLKQWHAKFEIWLFLVSVLSCLAYWYVASRWELDPALGNLWASVASGLLGAWITVYVIDRILRSRREQFDIREDVLRGARGATEMARRVPPRFYPDAILALSNHVNLIREHASTALGKKQLSTFFTDDEADQVLGFLALVEDVLLCFRSAGAAYKSLRVVDDDDKVWEVRQYTRTLIRAGDRAETRADCTAIRAELATAVAAVDAAQIDAPKRETASHALKVVGQWVSALDTAIGRVEEIDAKFQALRATFATNSETN